MRVEELGHFSQSSLNMFIRCPAQFMFRYIQGIKIPPSGAMTLGSTVDHSLDFNYKYKIDKREDRKVEEILEFFADDFDKEIQDTELKDEEDKGKIKDSGVKVIGLYQEEIAPGLMPIDSQKEVSFNLECSPIPIVGYIDVVDEYGTVIDNKVRGKSPQKDKITGNYLPSEAEKLQVSIYENGMLAENKPPSALRIDTMVTTIKPKIIRSEVVTTHEDLRYLDSIVRFIVKAVENEIFLPNRQSMLCSRRNCGYCSLCEKTFGGVVR